MRRPVKHYSATSLPCGRAVRGMGLPPMRACSMAVSAMCSTGVSPVASSTSALCASSGALSMPTKETNTAGTAVIHTGKMPVLRGFTLVELLVVIAIIVLLAVAVLPSIVGLFRAGSDSQAINVLGSQLSAARALAIRTGRPAGVHVQPGEGRMAGHHVMAVVQQFPYINLVTRVTTNYFRLAEGYETAKVPGSFAFGAIYNFSTVNGSPPSRSWDQTKLGATGALENFTTFTIVFDPSGACQVMPVTFWPGNLPWPDASGTNGDAAFGIPTGPGYSAPDPTTHKNEYNQYLWRYPLPLSNSVWAVVLFDAVKMNEAGTADRATYLTANGRIIQLNINTGQLVRQ